MSDIWGGFVLPFDPFTPAAAPARPWLDACACTIDAMTEWNRHLLGAMISPEVFAGLGWYAWQTLQPRSDRAWPPSSASRDTPEPSVLKPGLSPVDQAMDSWRQWIGQCLQQTRAQVDTAIDAWVTGLKFGAGTLATASPCQTDSGSESPAVARMARMSSSAARSNRQPPDAGQHAST